VIDGDPGVLELSPGGPDHLLLHAHLPHWEGLIHIAQRARRIFNLDANLEAAAKKLEPDPLIGPLVRARPGVRPPGTWDPFETGVRAIIGQQVGVSGAGTITARLVSRHGTPVPGLVALGLTHLFPSPQMLASGDLSGLGLTTARAAAISAFARAVAGNAIELDRGIRLDPFIESITAVPGVGPWTAQSLALRLGEPDAFPATDLGLRRSIARVAGRPLETREAERMGERWRPWRAFAATHLWFGTPSALRRETRSDGTESARRSA
jgi:AraC family transcriptional regulator, regulatory protein of adaptative response / DNA-3-methyladenine glycosylase II